MYLCMLVRTTVCALYKRGTLVSLELLTIC
jgi:hypothetical protein